MNRVRVRIAHGQIYQAITIFLTLATLIYCTKSYAEDLPSLSKLELIHSRPFHKMLDGRGRQYSILCGNGQYAWAIFVPPGARRTVIEVSENQEVETFSDILNADYPPTVLAMNFEGTRLLAQSPQGRKGVILDLQTENVSPPFPFIPKGFHDYPRQVRWDGNWLRYLCRARVKGSVLIQYSTLPDGDASMFRHNAYILGYGGLEDGTRLATIDQTGDIYYWSADDPKKPLRVFPRAAFGVKRNFTGNNGSFGPDGFTCVMQSDRPLLVFIDKSKQIHAFDLETGEDLWRGVNGEPGPVSFVQFEHSGHHVMIRKDSEWWIVSIPGGRVVQRFQRPEGEISRISGDLSTMIFTQHRTESIYHLDRSQVKE